MPFFSVIVPTRNRPDLLRRALLSISEQSFQDYEVLVVDDGSDPIPAATMKELVAGLGARFRLLHREPAASRHGPNVARNEGIRRATGRYVGFVDDDDYWCDTDHLRTAADYLGAESEVDIYMANQVAKRGDEVVVSSWLPHLEELARARSPRSETGIVRLELRDVVQPQGIGFVHVNMTLARRELVVATGGFWEPAPYEGDLNFFLRLIDMASGLAYRPATVAVNTVRATGAEEGVSSLDARSKLLFRLAACQHAELACTRSETRRYARLLQGGVWKTMAKEAYEGGDFTMARDLASRAVAVSPSFRWRLILVALRVRSLFGR